MPTKKPLPQKPHFHIPADPLRLRSEALQARHSSRKGNGVQELIASGGVTNEALYEMLSDVLERQELLESQLQNLIKLSSKR